MTDRIVWTTPVPSSGFGRGVTLHIEPGRTVVLNFDYESANGNMKIGELRFSEVISYEQIFYSAITPDINRFYYDRLCEITDSKKLNSAIEMACSRNEDIDFKNYRILFDDGPYFDIICKSFVSCPPKSDPQ